MRYAQIRNMDISNGEGIDFNKDFTIMNTQKFSGEIEQSEK